MTWLKPYAVNVMITQKSHQNLANIFKISISQEVRNTYFKGAFCWLKILIHMFEMKQYGCFVGIKQMLQFGMVEMVLRIEISKLRASSDSCKDIFKRSLEVITRLCL